MAGGGKSSQSQIQTFNDNRVVQGEGALYANNGARIGVTNYTLDGGAIPGLVDVASRVIDAGTEQQGRTLTALSDGIRQAFSLGSDAIASSDANTARALGFGGSALNFGSDALASNDANTARALGFGSSALNFGNDALSGAFDTVTRNNAGALNLASDALGTVGGFGDSLRQSIAQALNFAGDSQAGAFDTVTRNNVASLNFAGDALGTAGSFADRAAQAVAQAFNFGGDALGAVTGAVGSIGQSNAQAFNFGSDALAFGSDALARVLDASQQGTGRVIDSLNSTEQLVANAYNDAKGRGAMTDKLLLAAVAAMALVAVFAVKK